MPFKAIPAKCKMHQCVMVINTKYKFHKIPFIDYLVTAEYAYFILI